MHSNLPLSGYGYGVVDQQKVLRNTYWLLSLSMIFSGIHFLVSTLIFLMQFLHFFMENIYL